MRWHADIALTPGSEVGTTDADLTGCGKTRLACHSEESAIGIGGRRGISDCLENTQSAIPRCFESACGGGSLECGGSTPPLRLPQVYSKAASSRRTPRRCAQGHGFWVVVSRRACATVLKMLVREAPWSAAGRRRLCDYLRSIPRRRQAAALQGAARISDCFENVRERGHPFAALRAGSARRAIQCAMPRYGGQDARAPSISMRGAEPKDHEVSGMFSLLPRAKRRPGCLDEAADVSGAAIFSNSG